MLKIDTLVFDMDGVITTEEKYWACARLTLWELVTQTLGLADAFGDAIHDPAAREAVTSDDLIYALKGRAVNSNWDICYILVCTYLAALPGVRVSETDDPGTLLHQIKASASGSARWPEALSEFLTRTGDMTGQALIHEAGHHLEQALGINSSALCPEKAFWWYFHAKFQHFYHGDSMRRYGGVPLLDGTVIQADHIAATLKTLCEAGYRMGIATGRPNDELNDALGGVGLLDYFESARFGTLTAVREAEATLGITGLVKPHPYSLMRAIHPDLPLDRLMNVAFQKQSRPNVLMIGDSVSDPMMAKSAGCRCVGVLTGVRGDNAKRERQTLLIEAGCEAILPDITHLPQWLVKDV